MTDLDIERYERSRDRVASQRPDLQSMTHLGDKPRRPVSIDGGFIGRRELGDAPYDVAGPMSSLAQTAYDLKTAPLYATPAAPLAAGSDMLEGFASGSKGQAALGVLGAPLGPAGKAAGVAGAAMLPDQAQAGGALEMAKRALDRLGFFSKALEEAKGASMKAGTPQQWVNTLRKAGVKPAELEATGFNQLLFDRPEQKMAKDEVVKFLTDNRVKLAEHNAGRPGNMDGLSAKMEEARQEVDRLTAEYNDNFSRWSPQEANDAYHRLNSARRELSDRAAALDEALDGDPTRYGEYTLPGGKNYTESKLQLDRRKKEIFDSQRIFDHAKKLWEENRLDDPTLPGWADLPTDTRLVIYDSAKADLNPKPEPLFQSNHWPEPDILSHYRTKDRVGPNGERVLHLDEIQSDWAQAGREKGFNNPDSARLIADVTNRRNAARDAHAAATRDLYKLSDEIAGKFDYNLRGRAMDEYATQREATLRADPRYQEAFRRMDDAWKRLGEVDKEYTAVREANPPGEINPGPFVKDTRDWTDLTLKRALLKAQQEGYDAVALTPGAEQAKRYDLSERVKSVYYNPETRRLEVNGDSGDMLHEGTYTPDELGGVIGKENAQRLLQARITGGGYHHLAPESMDWGGEGMRAFYDRLVPERLSSIARRLDPEAKIESMPAGYRLDYERGATSSAPARVYDIEGTRDWTFPNLDEARQFASDNHFGRSGEIPTLPMLRLTPKMKEELKNGLPLFVGAPAIAGGALSALREPAPTANEFARGGLAQIASEEARWKDLERRSPGDEMIDDRKNRGLIPGYDLMISAKPPSFDELVKRRPVQAYGLGGDVDGGGNEYDGGTGSASYAGDVQAGGGVGGGWGDGFWDSWNAAMNDFSQNADSYADPGYYDGGTEAMAGGFSAGPTYGLNPDDYAKAYGLNNLPEDQPQGPSPVPDFTSPPDDSAPAPDPTGFNFFSPEPASMQMPDLVAPAEMQGYAPAPPEYTSPEATLSGPAPMSDLTAMAGAAAPMSSPSFSPTPEAAERTRETNRGAGFSDIGFDLPGNFVSEKTVGPYSSNMIGLSELSPTTYGQLLSVEQDPKGVRDFAKANGLTYEQALDTLNRPIVETIMNRAQTVGTTPLNVMNEYKQFSGVPGTFNKSGGRYPGDVQSIRPDEEMVASASRILGDIVTNGRQYPSAYNYFNPDVDNLPGWTDKMAVQPDAFNIGVSPRSHTFGNVDRRDIPGFDVAGPFGAPTATASRGPSVTDALPEISEPTQPAQPSSSLASAIGWADIPAAPMTIDRSLPTPVERDRPVPDSRFNFDISGYPSFVAADLAKQADRGMFTASQTGGIGRQAFENNTMGRAGSTVSLPDASTFQGMSAQPQVAGMAYADDMLEPLPDPINVSAPPGVAPLPPERPADLEDFPAGQRPSPTMNDRVATALGQNRDRYAVDPLTQVPYDPVTGNRVLNPSYVERGINGVVGLVPGLGMLNGLSSLFGGPSVGGVMSKGVPVNYDKITPADGSDRTYGGAGSDTHEAASQVKPPAAPAAPPPTSPNAPTTDPAAYLAYLRRKYLGEDSDPKTYGMRAQRRYFTYE